jgi:hypothetical protein
MNIRRITAVGLILFLAFVMLVTPVFAGKPHFTKASASGPDSSGALAVSFTLNGLGKLPNIPIEVTGDLEATYACKPAEGNFPPDPLRQVVSINFQPQHNYIIEKGSVSDVFVITPPGSTLICDAGMFVALAMITYSNVEAVTVIFHGLGDWEWVIREVPGTFSATYYGYTP